VTAYQYPPAASPYPVASPADPTAVMGRRSVAWIIDVLLFFLVASFFGPTPLSPFALYEKVPSGFDYGDACSQIYDRGDDVAACQEYFGRAYYIDNTDAIVASLVTLAYFLLIPVLLQGLKGFTPGKGIMGVRAVDEQGQVPGIGKALVRSLMWIVDAAPWVIPLVAPIVAFTSKGHRRVGDMAAKTFVIGKADMGRPVTVAGLTTAYSAGYGVPGGYPPPGQPGQPGRAPWDQPAPGGAAPVPGQAPVPGAWGAPTAPPGGSAPGAPGQPWNAPAPQGSPWAPPSTPSGSTTPSGGWPAPGGSSPSPTPSGESPAATPGGSAPSPTPSGESPAATPGGSAPSPTPSGESPAAPGSAIPLGAVGSTGPSTDSAPSGEPGASAAPSPGEPASGPAATPASGSAPGAATPSGESPAAAGQQQAGSGYEPQWDAARNTYILWEPNRRQWLGWDDSAKEWRPL
jgi:uncharacterized RDD family membrane protein YckC